MNKVSAQNQALEERLAELFGRRCCVIVGSGTAALYCIFESLASDLKGRLIVYPEITCETAVNASIFAGFRPAFSDVDPADGNMTGQLLDDVDPAEIAAVVPTHIYGHLMAIDRLDSTSLRTVPWIEDAAQGYGGTLNGRQAGSMGSAAIISFGDGKIVDCGSGGAVLTDDQALADSCRDIAATLPCSREAGEAERGAVMTEMMEVRRDWRSHRDRSVLLRDQRRILERNRSGYLWRMSSATSVKVLKDLDTLSEEAARRRSLAGVLDTLLDDVEGLEPVERVGEPALWRYAFLTLPEHRDEIHGALRRSGVRAAKLFAPCSAKFATEPDESSDAHTFSRRVLNVEWPLPGEERNFLTKMEDVLRPIAARPNA